MSNGLKGVLINALVMGTLRFAHPTQLFVHVVHAECVPLSIGTPLP